MRPTLQQVKEKFDFYNKLCFDGKLPTPPIKLNMRYEEMGVTKAHAVYHEDGSITYENLSIEISVRRDLPEIEYIDTLVHEMIHYYIFVNNLQDTSTHGKIFRAKMKEITDKYGIRITIAFDPKEEELIETKSDRYRYICVLDFDDERLGVAVVARGKIFEFWKLFPQLNHIREVKWYASNRAIFELFPTTVSPSYTNIDADKLQHYLTGAVELENTGKVIRPKR